MIFLPPRNCRNHRRIGYLTWATKYQCLGPMSQNPAPPCSLFTALFDRASCCPLTGLLRPPGAAGRSLAALGALSSSGTGRRVPALGLGKRGCPPNQRCSGVGAGEAGVSACSGVGAGEAGVSAKKRWAKGCPLGRFSALWRKMARGNPEILICGKMDQKTRPSVSQQRKQLLLTHEAYRKTL